MQVMNTPLPSETPIGRFRRRHRRPTRTPKSTAPPTEKKIKFRPDFKSRIHKRLSFYNAESDGDTKCDTDEDEAEETASEDTSENTSENINPNIEKSGSHKYNTRNNPRYKSPLKDTVDDGTPKQSSNECSPSHQLVNDLNKLSIAQPPPKPVQKSSIVRIVKSERLFKRYHTYKGLLVEPSDSGSGCLVYESTWKDEPAVTKLLPVYAQSGFSEEDNLNNALRESDFHCGLYRKAVKRLGKDNSGIVSIYASVLTTHRIPEKWEHPISSGDESDDEENAGKARFLALVMPKLDCNLKQFVDTYRPFTREECWKLLRCFINFLTLLKEDNIVHNDIKPENIFIRLKSELSPSGRCHKTVAIDEICFADFGCSVSMDERFPFANICGTLTMWDLESMGDRYGKENGFSFANDLFGCFGSLSDGVFGYSIVERMLEIEDPNYDDADWPIYTEMIRKCRRLVTTRMLKEKLAEVGCTDPILVMVVMQLAKPREERHTLQQLSSMIMD